jgi:hypothetical protein
LLESDWDLHNRHHSQWVAKGDYALYSTEPSPWPCACDRGLTGTLSITTNQGTLNISDVGVLDTTNNVFSEIDRIESSTGIFFGARGILFISGNEMATGFTWKVTGNVCLQSEQ